MNKIIRFLLCAFSLHLTAGHATELSLPFMQGDIHMPLPTSSHETKRWDFFADLLIWNLQQTCDQWAFVLDKTLLSPPPTFSGKFKDDLSGVTFGWDPGLRTGVCYNLDYDQWDTSLYYTWYQTSTSKHLVASPSQTIQSQFIATDFLLSLPGFSVSFGEAKINWHVLFNMFNWDVGRTCWLGQSLSLRPHVGIQGGWIHQTINVDWLNSFTLTPYNAVETLRHRFWGVGPEVGVDSKWHLASLKNNAFSLFGDFAGVFMWGHWSFNEVAHTTIDVVTRNTQPDRDMGSLTFLSSAGLVWDAHFHDNRSLFSLKLGYELQVWPQQLQFFQHFSGILNNALILQGGTCRLLFEF